MPPFPERESSILAKLKKRQPDKTKERILEKENKTDMERPAPNVSVTNDGTNSIQVREQEGRWQLKISGNILIVARQVLSGDKVMYW